MRRLLYVGDRLIGGEGALALHIGDGADGLEGFAQFGVSGKKRAGSGVVTLAGYDGVGGRICAGVNDQIEPGG